MTRQAAHYETATKRDLSQRQREVLALIAAGKTNGEVAQELGISLDGAKWHVSEILGKVGVSTREEAAEWWLAQRGLRSRVTSFLRVFAPLASWKVAAGSAAAAVIVVAVGLAFALRGSETQPKSPPECDLEKVILEPIEARTDQGYFQLAALMASAETECSFRGAVSASVASPQSLPAGFNLPVVENLNGTIDIVIGPQKTPLVFATWRSWCASIPTTQLTFHLNRPGRPFPGKSASPLFLVNSPPCIESEGVSPIVVQSAASSSFAPDLGPSERIACYADPEWQTQCEQVDRLQTALQGTNGLGRLAEAFVQFAAPSEYTCPVSGYDGTTICQGASAGETRGGIAVAFHGSEGDVLSVAMLRERLGEWINRGVTRVATIGCPVSGDCDQRFIIGFAVDAQPAAFYLVFESRPKGVALVGAGVAGDIALEIRRGGTAFTGFGETLFTSVTPPY